MASSVKCDPQSLALQIRIFIFSILTMCLTETVCAILKQKSGHQKLKWLQKTNYKYNQQCGDIVIYVYKWLPPQADCLMSMSVIPPQCSPMPFHLGTLLNLPILLLLLKLMTWLLISRVWGPSTLSNGIIQAPFIPLFNYS